MTHPPEFTEARTRLTDDERDALLINWPLGETARRDAAVEAAEQIKADAYRAGKQAIAFLERYATRVVAAHTLIDRDGNHWELDLHGGYTLREDPRHSGWTGKQVESVAGPVALLGQGEVTS